MIYGYATYSYELQGEDDDDRLWLWYERHGFELPTNEWKHARLKANMYRGTDDAVEQRDPMRIRK